MQRICAIILAVMLAGCSTRKTATLYGVEVKGTPFDLMERLVYEAHDQCMPVEFLPMADGMYIFAILADGEEVVIYCETDKNNQITNIKVSNTMLDINSQFTPPLSLQRTENQRFTTRRNVAHRRRPFGAADGANSQVQTFLPDQRLSAHLYRDRGASHGRACFSRALQDLCGVSRTADC